MTSVMMHGRTGHEVHKFACVMDFHVKLSCTLVEQIRFCCSQLGRENELLMKVVDAVLMSAVSPVIFQLDALGDPKYAWVISIY
jgi:hypothetical protein